MLVFNCYCFNFSQVLLFVRKSNKYQNIKHFWVGSINFSDVRWMKEKFGIFYKHFFCKNYLINSVYESFLGGFFDIIIKDLVNEGQILNFYKHFIHKNFATNFKISGFVGFAGWICSLDFISRLYQSFLGSFFWYTYQRPSEWGTHFKFLLALYS